MKTAKSAKRNGRDFIDIFIEKSLTQNKCSNRAKKGKKASFGTKCVYGFAAIYYMTVIVLVLL